MNLTDEGEADSELMEDDSISFTQDDFDYSSQVRQVDSWAHSQRFGDGGLYTFFTDHCTGYIDRNKDDNIHK